MTDWLTEGLPHIWLPCAQMTIAATPLTVVATLTAAVREVLTERAQQL